MSDEEERPALQNSEERASLHAANSVFQVPGPSPVYILSDAVRQIAGVELGEAHTMRFMPFGAVRRIARKLGPLPLVPHERMVWAITVAKDVIVDDAPGVAPRTVHGLSMVIDAETGHVLAVGKGVLMFTVA